MTEENIRREKLNQHRSPDCQLKKITVRKIISEFITHKTVHYLDPLSRVKHEDAQCLTVETVNKPLNDAFYQQKNLAHIHFEVKNAPLRAAFEYDYFEEKNVYVKAARDSSIDGHLKEQSYLKAILGDQARLSGEHIAIAKNKNDKFFTISLGSQSSITILKYVDSFIEQAIQAGLSDDQKMIFFVVSGKNDGSSSTMYAKVRAHLNKRMSELEMAGIPWPSAAKILPLAFQDDKHMASLFQNSDILITRTGGMSSIEANETQKFNENRKVYVHSEENPAFPEIFPKDLFDSCYAQLLSGTVRWEGGNAQYLMQSVGACLTSPDTILFNLDEKTTTPSFKNSLLELAYSNKLDEHHVNEIIEALHAGSNPNMESLLGLPIIAYAKDMKTLQLLIEYGGKITKEVYGQLKQQEVKDLPSSKELRALENSTRKSINDEASPVRKAFLESIDTNNIKQIKGLLYRYPQLAYLRKEVSKDEKEFNATKNVKQHQELDSIFAQARGMTRLEFMLRNAPTDLNKLRYMIYQSQSELNTPNSKGETPLTLCTDHSLRLLMVKLGANPIYLSKEVSVKERQSLRYIYREDNLKVEKLRKCILDAFYNHTEDESKFCEIISTEIKALLSKDEHFYVADALAKSIFISLKEAKSEVQHMPIIQQIYDFIKCLFAADFSSELARAQSRKLLFYSNSSDNPLKHDVSEESPLINCRI